MVLLSQLQLLKKFQGLVEALLDFVDTFSVTKKFKGLVEAS